jgi:hypothetical protein
VIDAVNLGFCGKYSLLFWSMYFFFHGNKDITFELNHIPFNRLFNNGFNICKRVASIKTKSRQMVLCHCKCDWNSSVNAWNLWDLCRLDFVKKKKTSYIHIFKYEHMKQNKKKFYEFIKLNLRSIWILLFMFMFNQKKKEENK